MGVVKKTDRPQLNIADQGDGTTRTYLLDPLADGSAFGTDVNEELYIQSEEINTRPNNFSTDDYPAENPGYMWWAKDLEMYIPYLNHYNKDGGGGDGGMKVYVFSDTTQFGSFTGKDVEEAFNSGQKFLSPIKAKDLPDKYSKNYWGNWDQHWLPVLGDNGIDSVQTGVGSCLILDFGYDDDAGDNAQKNYINNVCEDFFSPPIYEYISDSEESDLDNVQRYHGYFQSDSYARQFFGSPFNGNEEGFNRAVKVPSPNTSEKFDGGSTYIDFGPDSEGLGVNGSVSDGSEDNKPTKNTVSYGRATSGAKQDLVGFGKLGMMGDQNMGSGYNFPEDDNWKKARNSVMPYCRDIIVKTNQHVNGGSFRCSSDGGYGYGSGANQVDTDRDSGNGAFGRRRRLATGFSIDNAFPQGLEDFSMKAKQAPDQAGYYYIAICLGYEATEMNSDDVTDAEWTLFKISKNDVYKFLNTKDAQFLVLNTKVRAFISSIKDDVTGMYDTRRTKISGQDNLSNNGNIFAGISVDNFGQGDESGKWGGDDKRGKKGEMAEITVVFRKPNPFRQYSDEIEDSDIDDINNRIKLGIDEPEFQHIRGDKLFVQQYGINNVPGYIPFHETNLRYKLNPGHLKNFGLWGKNSNSPILNEFDPFKPLVYSFSVDFEDDNTSNQIYYSDDTEEFIKTTIPSNVIFVCDILNNQNLIDEDPNQINFDSFTEINRQGISHFVNSSNIGYKWALVESDKSNRLSYDDLLMKLNQFYNSPNSLQPIQKRGLFNFQDIFITNEFGETVFNPISKSYQLPGLHLNTFLVYKYHLIDVDGIAYVQPLRWSAVTVSHFLTSTGYYIEDFSELGGPGFTTLPFPATTPIISGLSPASKYLRSVDDIFDANLFTAPQILDKIKIKNTQNNEELGKFLGDADLGQTRIFNKAVRMRELLDINEFNRPYYDYEFYIGEEDLRYPTNSAATTVFIDTVDNLKDTCIVEINPGVQTKGLLRDSSGNENKGILIGDYALSKDDRETELQRDSNMKTPNISSTYKAF